MSVRPTSSIDRTDNGPDARNGCARHDRNDSTSACGPSGGSNGPTDTLDISWDLWRSSWTMYGRTGCSAASPGIRLRMLRILDTVRLSFPWSTRIRIQNNGPVC